MFEDTRARTLRREKRAERAARRLRRAQRAERASSVAAQRESKVIGKGKGREMDHQGDTEMQDSTSDTRSSISSTSASESCSDSDSSDSDSTSSDSSDDSSSSEESDDSPADHTLGLAATLSPTSHPSNIAIPSSVAPSEEEPARRLRLPGEERIVQKSGIQVVEEV